MQEDPVGQRSSVACLRRARSGAAPARAAVLGPRRCARLGGIACWLALHAALDVGVAAAIESPRISGTFETYGILRFDWQSPRQRPLGRIDLAIEQKIAERTRVKLSAIGSWGGTIENSSGAGLIDFGHAFQNPDPSLQLGQAYVDHSTDTIDVRVGTQVFTWGRLDGIRPNDQLNPRIYLDPFLTDEVAAKVPVPAVSVAYAPDGAWAKALPEESRLTFVWVPFVVPWRFPLEDERWFAPAARVSQNINVGASVDPRCPCSFLVDQTVGNVGAPARTFDNGGFGIRYTARSYEVDWAITYYDGFDSTPSFDLKLQIDPVVRDDVPDVLETNLDVRLRPAFERYRSLGADFETAIGAVTVRGEGAFRFRRPYSFDLRALQGLIEQNQAAVEQLAAFQPVDVPAFVKRDAVDWGLGADYTTHGLLTLLEVQQLVLLHNDQRLLVRDVDTRIALVLQKSFLDDRLHARATGLWGIESGYELVRGELTYDFTDHLSARVGILGIWGSANSLIGQYEANSEAYAAMRYSF